MKTNLNLLLKVVFVCALKQLGASGAISEMSERLFRAGAIRANEVIRDSSEAVAAVQAAALQAKPAPSCPTVQQLEKQRIVAQQCDRALQRSAAQRALAVARDTYVRAEQLSRHTVEAIEKIIQRAEAEAFAIKRNKRRQLMKTFLTASRNNEKMAWKYGLRDEYLQHLQTLEGIVKQGENADAYRDLAESFSRQREWFIATLEKMNNPADKNYFLLFQKAQALKNILVSFDRVANILDQRVHRANITVYDIDKARVLALYDIQALITEKEQPDGIAEAALLSMRECGLVVDGLFNKLAARKKIDDLVAKKDAIGQELLAREELLRLSYELADRQQQELGAMVEKARREAGLQNKVDEAHNVQAFPVANVVPLVEGLNKENANLQLIILDQKQSIERLKAATVTVPLADTKTEQQPLVVAPMEASQGTLTVNQQEQLARAALENELQQKMVRG